MQVENCEPLMTRTGLDESEGKLKKKEFSSSQPLPTASLKELAF